MLPTGELTFWVDQFNCNINLESISIKVFMLLPSLLLQKPRRQSKAKEHSEKLAERFIILEKWWNYKLIERGKGYSETAMELQTK